MSELPQGWTMATIMDLVGEVGLATDGDWIESKDQDPDGDVRLIQLADVGDGHFVNKSRRFLTAQTARRLNCTFLATDDVLIARMPDPLGRACIFPGVDRPAVTAVDVFICRLPGEAVEPRWFMHFINSPDRRDVMLSQAGGTTRQRIAGGRVKQLDIPTPPVPEQRRIAAKIDSLSAKSNRARDHLDHISRLVEHYKRSVLEAAFRGDLTDTWRRERALPVVREVTLSTLVNDIRYGTAAKCTPEKVGVAVLRIPNVSSGSIDLSDLKYAPLGDRDLRKLALQEGDILVIRSNGSPDLVGRAAEVMEDAVGLAYAGYLIRLRVDRSVAVPGFVRHMLSAPAVRAVIEVGARSTSGVHNINSVELARLVMPLPSLPEQHEIVRRIEAAFAWIDRLASEATSARRLVDRLDQAILAKAFRGELVPQDPADEPASVLLDRIREERAGGPKARRGRRLKTAATSA